MGGLVAVEFAEKLLFAEGQKNKLIALAKKHHRNRGDDKIVGKKIADGLFIVNLKTIEDIKNLVTRAQNITPDAAAYLQSELDDNPDNNPLDEKEYYLWSNFVTSANQLNTMWNKQQQLEEERQKRAEQKRQTNTEQENNPSPVPTDHTPPQAQSPAPVQTVVNPPLEEKNKSTENKDENKDENKNENKKQDPKTPAVTPPTTPKNPQSSKNLCVIDIGTNAVKCNSYINGEYKVAPNKQIARDGKDLDKKSVVDSVVEFFENATQNKNTEEKINPQRVFIVATEGFRTSPNAEQMKSEILEKTGRKVHIISPEREAFFSIYGGLKYIPKDENQPRYVLFVESGGGSTEISVVDTQKHGPSSILSTISLPLGSRETQIDGDEAKTEAFVAENIKQLLETLKKKGVSVSPSSLGLVINSGIASRIMWKKKHKDGEKYNPKHVTLNRYGMSVADFSQELASFLQDTDNNKEKATAYGIANENQISGFKAHAQILKPIMSEVEKQFPDGVKNCQVLTTNGGLKEGLMKQIEYLDGKGKSSEEIENELLVTDKPENLPKVTQENDDFKDGWREFANKVAAKLNGEMEEDTQAKAFVAKVITKETTTSITATSSHDVSLGAQKKDGSATVPDQTFFDELAIKSKNSGINFGNIQSAEFKARLMIACLKHNVTMTGQPELNDEFLNSLDADGDSAKFLKAYKHKLDTQQQQKQPTPTPTPAQSNYEKTRDEREKMLELHSKTRTLTPQEQHELQYLKDFNEQKQAKEQAIARTGDKSDPRTAEHTKESGLLPEDYSFHSQTPRNWRGWKLHLDVVPNRNDPTTKAVSEFLETVGVDHKIYHGGENGKGMTIYVGSYDDTIKLAKEINSRFGKNIAEPPLYTDQKGEEIEFNKKVTGRFYLQNWYSIQYPRSSIHGICPAEYGSAADENMCSLLAGLATREQIISKDFALELIPHDNNFHDNYVFRNLEFYCSHKLYQKHLGEFYCGKDADKFEEQIFGDALPPKGSPERATWDKLADLYIQKSENDYPQGIQKMADLKANYTPIDFNKVPPLVRPQKSNTGNQP